MPTGCYKRTIRTLSERFWAKVVKSDACWEWHGATWGNNGYGCVYVAPPRDVDSAHKVSWRMHFGEIPQGMCVLHKCDNPVCVRPDHLFIGTHADNMRDKMEKGRWRGRPNQRTATA